MNEKEECINYLEDMGSAWEPEHGIPYLRVLKRINNDEIKDYSMTNIKHLVEIEKHLLSWKQ